MAEEHSCTKVIIPELVYSKGAKTGEDFGAEGGSKRNRTAKLWQFSQRRPKPAFSEKVQGRDQGKFFKIRPKSSPRFKGPRGLWCKWIIL